jgi:hypothetical protein
MESRMERSSNIHWLLVQVAAALVFGVSARASGVEMAAKVKAYAERHNLPVREVPIDLPGRKLTRLFVPVTDASAKDFIEEFTRESVLLRQSQTDAEHLHLAFGPEQVVWYGGLKPGPVPDVLEAMNGGRYLGIALQPELKMHLTENIGVRHPDPAGRAAGCMWWLVHARVGQDRPLMHELGLKQSMASSNMVKKMIHAGTDAVVVGVAMTDLASRPRLIQLNKQIAINEQAILKAEQEITRLGRPNAYLEMQLEKVRDQIAQLELSLAQYGAEPQYAQHLPGLRNQLAQRRQLLEDLSKNPPNPFAQQLLAYDASIAQLEEVMRQHAADPLYQRQVADWQVQIERQRQAKAAHLAAGEASYDPLAAPIQQKRDAIALWRTQLADFRKEAADLQRVVAAPQDHIGRFNRMTDAELMGAPPGGGAIEAVRQ